MLVSDLRVIGQMSTTIGLGLLFDTLIVRSFMTPAIATLLGRGSGGRFTYVAGHRARDRLLPRSTRVKHWDGSVPGGKLGLQQQPTRPEPRKQAENPR